jgi:hypothetical protein
MIRKVRELENRQVRRKKPQLTEQTDCETGSEHLTAEEQDIPTSLDDCIRMVETVNWVEHVTDDSTEKTRNCISVRW